MGVAEAVLAFRVQHRRQAQLIGMENATVVPDINPPQLFTAVKTLEPAVTSNLRVSNKAWRWASASPAAPLPWALTWQGSEAQHVPLCQPADGSMAERCKEGTGNCPQLARCRQGAKAGGCRVAAA